MKRKEIKDISASEYESKITEFRKELIKLNAQASTGTAMKNPGMLRQTKKNIARILTMMKQKGGASKKA